MNLVRMALIGVALGLLAIGLPGSEDTPARQQPHRVCLVTSQSQPMAQLAAPEPLRVWEMPRPANQFEDEEESIAEAEQPWVEEEPPVEEAETVWLVALNRPISLEPTYQAAEPPVHASRSAKPRRSISQRIARLRQPTSSEAPRSNQRTSPYMEADLEQARANLSGMLNEPREPHTRGEFESADAYRPMTTRFTRQKTNPTTP